MIDILLNIIKIIFLLGFLVFIHEGGHFLIAKLFKIKVLEFAIGFGPTIWSKQGKETKYALRLFPFGGFVNMLGEENRSEEENSYSKASIPKRIGILVAGGLVNIIFGILVYFILVGTSNQGYISTTIKEIMPNYAAEAAGLQINDKILEINGQKIRVRSDITDIFLKYQSGDLDITIERESEEFNVKLKPTEIQQNTIGVFFGVEGENLSTEIKSLYENSPAIEAGLKPGDIITKVDGTEVENNVYTAVELIQNSKNEKIKITVQRNEENLEFEIEPNITKAYILGVIFKDAEQNFTNRIYYAFWETIRFLSSIIDNLKELFIGNVGADQLMGPVGISEIVSETENTTQYIYLLALISLSLGITNLLPFPPLDGGKVVLLIIEAIRKKPLKEKTEINIQMIGFFLLIALSIYVTFNDITRIF